MRLLDFMSSILLFCTFLKFVLNYYAIFILGNYFWRRKLFAWVILMYWFVGIKVLIYGF